MEIMEIQIKTPFIKLGALLKLSGVAMTGGEAAIMLEEGLVSLEGETLTQRGKKIYPGSRVDVALDEDIVINVVEQEIEN